MQLPIELQLKIESILEGISLNALKRAAETLSTRYRSGKKDFFLSKEEHLAYLIVRMPATYAVLMRVLQEWGARGPHSRVLSALDIGAGPGTGGWALRELFPNLEKVTLLEKDPSFAALGKKLMEGQMPHVTWGATEVTGVLDLEAHDLVMASFSLGEMKGADLLKVVAKMWEAAQKGLVIIEPGTPEGFERIRKIRSYLIEQGAFLLAPCPHSKACPMSGEDWCHFAARVERSSWHRRLKGAALNYEDEKFSYVIFAKEEGVPAPTRILARPEKKSGYVRLKLCADSGIIYKNIPKSAGEMYRWARQSDWGDG